MDQLEATVTEPIVIKLTPERLEEIIMKSITDFLAKQAEVEKDVFISPKKAARILDVTVRTLDNYRELRKYRNPQYSKLVRYKKSEVEAFLKKSDFLGNLISE